MGVIGNKTTGIDGFSIDDYGTWLSKSKEFGDYRGQQLWLSKAFSSYIITSQHSTGINLHPSFTSV